MNIDLATPKELETIKEHMRYNQELQNASIQAVGRDDDNILCVTYRLEDGMERWYHYNGDTKEWW